MARSSTFIRPSKGSSPSYGLWLGLAMVVLLADQFTKVLIISSYRLGEGFPVTTFFNIVRVHNEGAAFSFLASAGGWQRWFFTALGVLAAGVMVWMLKKTPGPKAVWVCHRLHLGRRHRQRD